MPVRLAAAALLFCAAACIDNGVTCDTGTADVGEICLPQTLAPGLAAVVQARELCGRGCSGLPACTALLRNAQVVLDIEQDVCTDTLTTDCLAEDCQQRIIPCVLPALNPGDYPLLAPGLPARLLHVAAGGQASCRFSPGDGGLP